MSQRKKKTSHFPLFHQTTLAWSLLSIGMGIAPTQASIVTDSIDYQYFRDFAENKGKFAVGANQIEVIDKDGLSRGFMFADGTPMPDWSMISVNNGVAHLIAPQYIASVKHNRGYESVNFGTPQHSHHPERNFDYLLVDRNIKSGSGENGRDTNIDDYHIPRLHKLVTESAPIPVLKVENLNILQNRERFPYIVRNGAGTHVVRPMSNSQDREVAGAYQFLVGGNIMNRIGVLPSGELYIGAADKQSAVNSSAYGPMPTATLGGDSGSPIIAYDNEQKQWVAIAVHRAGNQENGSWVVPHQNDFIDEKIKEDKVDIQNKVPDARIIWQANENVSTITSPHDPNLRQTVKLYDKNQANPDDTRFRHDLNHGQTVHFSGENTTLRLGGDIHQGAGALYFDNNMTVIGSRDNVTWLGAGVSVADGKTVDWRVHNPQGDRLSKIGSGSLNVSGKGENFGDISVGDGKVLLNQQADNSGKKQAFNSVHITSGRGTVVLGDDSQVNPDNIVFGYRGGRLDLNGNDLTFNRLRTVDAGAKIVNHNDKKAANLTLTVQGYQEKDLKWLNFGESGLGLYEYKNNHKNNRLDYFVLKPNGNPNAYFPTEAVSNENWAFLGHDRNEAMKKALQFINGNHQIFQGNLGEIQPTDVTPNHALNVHINAPSADKTLILSGDVNLNGKLSVKNSTVLLSGSPVPHAYDHIGKKDVVLEDEWLNRTFTAQTFEAKGNGVLSTSRNVAHMTGNVLAQGNATINLGAVNGQTDNCYHSDYTGKIHCDNATIADQNVVTLNVSGNVHAQDHAHINVNNATISSSLNAQNHAKITLKNNVQAKNIQLNDNSQLNFSNPNPLKIAVSGSRQSQVVLHENSHWHMPDNSKIGHLDGKTGSQITLNPEKNPNEFKNLTLNGDLTGSIQFNHQTDLAQGKADTLTIHGYATGNHTLAVQNTGAEAKVAELDLVALKHGGQESKDVEFKLKNDFVDAGTWRYVLKNDANNRYYLFNEQKANEIKAQKDAEAQKAEEDAQKAKQALEDAIKAREDAEKALAEALKNGGANTQDLAAAQKQAEDAQKLAEQATADKANAEKQLAQISQQLTDAQTAQSQAEQSLQEALNAKNSLQNQLDEANLAKNQAENATKQAQTALQQALDDKKQADFAKNQAEQSLQNALTAQADAEAQKTQAQKDLADIKIQKTNLEQQLANIQNAQTANNTELADLKNQLNSLNQQLGDKEKALNDAQIAQDLAKQAQTHAENLKTQAEQQLNQANQNLTLANQQKDEALSKAHQAEQAKNQAEQQLDQIQTQLSQAQADKTHAEQKWREAELAQQNAEKIQQDLQQAQTHAQNAQKLAEQAQKLAENEAKKQADLAKQNQADLEKVQAALNQANTDKNQAQTALAQAILDKQNAENALKLAQQNGSADVAKLAQDLADAQAQITQKTNELQNAVNTQTTLQNDLANKQQELASLQTQLTQAQDEAKRQTELTKLAELTAQNAQLAQKQAEDAQKVAQLAQEQAEQAQADLASLNTKLQANATNNAQTIAQIQHDLSHAQTQLNEKNQAVENAKNALNAANQQMAQIQTQNTLLQTQLQQEQQLREQIELAKNEALAAQKSAEQAKEAALLAQTQSENEKKQAEQKWADAQKLADEKTELLNNLEQEQTKLTETLAQTLTDLQNQQNQLAQSQNQTQLALAQAQEAQAKAEAEQAEKERLAKLLAAQQAQQNVQAAQNKKQAEIISQYANSALSEVSATAHHLQHIGQRINERLQQLNGRNSGVWLQTDAQKTQYSSDQYRGYKQNSTLTQIGADRTLPVGTGHLTVGASLNHLRYDADYDDGFTGKGQMTTGTVYTKWHHESGLALTGDVSAGQAQSQLQHPNTPKTEMKRNVTQIGLGVAQNWETNGVDIQAHTGVRYHQLGSANYAIAVADGTQVQVKQDNIGITSLTTGVNVGKTIQTANGFNLRPHVGLNYRHTSSEAQTHINYQALNQKFANEITGQIGLDIGKNNWAIQLKADYNKNSESGHRKGALMGVNFKF